MSVAVDTLVTALRDAGLLAGTHGSLPSTVRDVADDSRRVREGGCFCAVRGVDRDGHAFLEAARAAGATLAVVAADADSPLPALRVHDTRRAAATVAAAVYGQPAASLTLVGVTGTNGKTTTVGMLRHLLDTPTAPAASIGTLGVLLGSAGLPLEAGGDRLTTPGPVELQRLLRALVDRGVRRVALEASSHALDQHRLDGLALRVAVFTNLTRDHLDYHGTMAAYFAAKARLVGLLAAEGTAVVNADDAAWAALPPAPLVRTFGLASDGAEVRAEAIRVHPAGTDFTLVVGTARAPVSLPLPGAYNVANALAAAAAALTLGHALPEVAARLSTLPQVPGRLERLHDAPVVLRDYAHTPDALERCLRAVRPLADARGGRLLVVFGCGGDRDRGKRPEMGRLAEALADVVVLTSDNPRTEDPERILDDIAAGMTGGPAVHERIEDRRRAIARVLALAAPADVVVLAGKGHETYQVRGTVAHPFDEAAIVHELVAAGRPAGAA
jgi:UDP-N-acetylmuramoyl-L-alanyl-D-glutamate--2,6-diaminopimelate ligase